MKELRSRIRFPQFRAEVLNARDIWRCLETFLVVIIWGGRRGATASNGWRPGLLLNTLERTGQAPQQRITQPRMSVVPVSRNSGLEEFVSCDSSKTRAGFPP